MQYTFLKKQDMKKRLLLALTLTFALSWNAQAQIVESNEEEIEITDQNGETEYIELPEAMTSAVDSLLHLYNTQTYLVPDTNCNYPDFNPSYDQETYVQRLRQLPTIMEMSWNEIVQKFIDRYASRMRRSVSMMLGVQNFYMPIFEQALETYGLPLELKYLPVIESGLNPNAVSRVGATGLWQFMLATGKQYGLEVNSLVDERKDPVKSSYAAAHYLSDLYRIFGDWNLVIAAYNCGPEKISKAIHRAEGQKDYWQIYPYLPQETRGYVPAFIAANYIMNYYCEHNICPMLTNLPVKTDTIVVNRDVHFDQIAHVLDIDPQQLRELNPQYRHDIVNGTTKPSAIRLPQSLVGPFIDQEDSIYAYQSDQLLTKRTVVEVNDDVPTVAQTRKSYSRSKSSSSRGKKGKASKRGRKGKRGSGKSVTVKGGDTLSEIARRNGTTVSKLKKMNKIKGNTIKKGQKIKVK